MLLKQARVNNPDLIFRSAAPDDLDPLIALLKDDAIAASRKTKPGDEGSAYADAFQAIMDDPNNDLIVAEQNGMVIGFLQITFIPGLGRKGALRMQIEPVRIAAEHQNKGAGTALMQHAIELGHDRGAALAQLTTDKRRTEAHRFYERLGFEASHAGYKMVL